MSHISTITYALDAVGAFGLLAGGYLATKSKYSQDKSKDAVILIGLQEKRIKILEDTNQELQGRVGELTASINKMSGELTSYRKLKTIDPEIVVKLTSTLDSILQVLPQIGTHINTQQVDKQVIKGTP